jgi:tagaturonate reductase
MILSKENLAEIKKSNIEVPDAAIFELPEKVLQFGTGVLLRGLCNHYIDIANKQQVFNGRIAVVKSTNGGNEFESQDSLYTLCLRGIDETGVVEKNHINASISRVLLAKQQWAEIVNIATSDELTLVISNTTEVGIAYVNENVVDVTTAPESFPAKLLALLYKRYQKFNADESKGLVIVPTELITDNGNTLKNIILQLVKDNNLDDAFLNWLNNANTFCNSLVDRIVPGKPTGALEESILKQTPYTDNLKVVAELYNLWAIQGNEKVKAAMSFASVNPEIIIAEDIDIYRELKLRLLNGSHTFNCALAHLAGFTIVREAFQNDEFIALANKVIYKEIASAIPYKIDEDVKQKFGESLFNRFVNPFLEHKWLDITLHFSSKMKMRNVSLLQNYYKVNQSLPECMCLGFAAYIYFLKCTLAPDGNYYGNVHGKDYKIQDAQAAYFAELWSSKSVEEIAKAVTTNESLWDTNLDTIPGFTNEVANYIHQLINKGAKEVIKNIATN